MRTLVNSQGVCSRIRRAAAIMTNIYTNAESVDLLRNSRRIWGDSTLPIVTPLQRKAVGFQSHYVLRKRLLMCSELEDTFRVDWKEVGMTEKLEPKHSLGKISWTRGGKTRLKCETANKDALGTSYKAWHTNELTSAPSNFKILVLVTIISPTHIAIIEVRYYIAVTLQRCCR